MNEEIQKRIEEVLKKLEGRVEATERSDLEASLRSFAAQTQREQQAAVDAALSQAQAEHQAAVEALRNEMESNTQETLRAFALATSVREVESRVDELVNEMRITPAQAPLVQALQVALLGVEGEARSFAAADLDPEVAGKSLYSLFNEFLDSIPARRVEKERQVRSIESVTKTLDRDRSNYHIDGSRSYSAYLNGDLSAAANIAKAVDAYRKRNPKASYIEAYQKVIQGQGGNDE